MTTSKTEKGLEILNIGLTPVYQDESPQVDIVLLHGLNGHPRETWTAVNDCFWPAELLPAVLKEDDVRARVMVYGWNANVFAFPGNNATTDMIHHHAQTLVAHLVAKRRKAALQRPIIFIGHSLGGILIKRALNYSYGMTEQRNIGQRSIYLSTYGIVFLGTPHTGADPARLGRMLQSMVHAVFPKFVIDTKGNLLDTLKTQSETLQNINVDFNNHVNLFTMFFFHESVPTNLYLLGKKMVVDESSAGFLVPGGQYSSIEETHTGMCRYDSMNANGCELVTGAISTYAADALWPIEQRWKNELEIRKVSQAHAARDALSKFEGGGSNDTGQSSSSIHTTYGNLPANVQEPSKSPEDLRPRNEHYFVPRHVSSNFTGRAKVLKILRESLLTPPSKDVPAQQRRFVLYGLGGSGKSQLCVKFAQDNREMFWGIFWVDASRQETAEQSFVEVAKSGGLEGSFEAGKRRLSDSLKEWLLIIDNADHQSIDISGYFPAVSRGCIIITSRVPDNKCHATVGSYELGDMDIEDGITLLLKAAAEDASNSTRREQASPIAEKLGYLALALVQAGATIRQKYCILEDYLEIYAQYHKDLMRKHPGQGIDGYKETVYTTWEISLRAIEDEGSVASLDAVELLNISGFLHLKDIPEEIFKEVPAERDYGFISKILATFRSFFSRTPTAWDQPRIRSGLVQLFKFSLINFGVEYRSFSMHPLVHAWTRDRLSEGDRHSYSRTAAIVLANSIQPRWEATDYLLRRRLVDHVDFYLNDSNPLRLTDTFLSTTQAELASKFALVFYENGKYEAAEHLYKQALAGMEHGYEREHLYTLTVVNYLALVLDCQAKYEEAEELIRRPVKGRQRILGSEDPATLDSISNLAVILESQGKHQAAELVNRQALDGREKSKKLGPDHLDTLKSTSNLAGVLRSLGKYNIAEEMSRRALKAYEIRLGPQHPDTLTSMNDLAWVLQRQGCHKEAEKLYGQVHESHKKVLGVQHPHTLTSMCSLAWSLHQQGEYQAAEKMGLEALERRKSVLRPQHPDILTSVSDLSRMLQSQGKYVLAEEMNRRALNGYKRELGSDHPYTLTCVDNLVGILEKQKKYVQAEELSQEVLDLRTKAQGLQHPDTLTSMSNRAQMLKHRGDYKEAEILIRRVLSQREESLGSNHPDTLLSMSNLALILQKQAKYDEAEDSSRRVLAGYEQTFDPDHPNTLLSIYCLAVILGSRKKYDEALILFEKACKGFEVKPGPDHDLTKACFKHFNSMQQKMEANGQDLPQHEQGQLAESRKRKEAPEEHEMRVAKIQKS